MKNFYFFSLVLVGILLGGPRAEAQSDYAFQEGDLVLNAGIGLGTTFTFAGSLGLPFGAGVEYGITDAMGVGGFLGYASG